MQPAGDGDLELEGPQWAFAVDLYQRPRVSEACLLLQDRLGVDVSLLLFALFAAANRGRMLGTADLAELERTAAPWRDEVVRPLRALRRRLKSGPGPASGPAAERLRERIKAAELHAEQIELAVLARRLDRCLPALHPGAAVDTSKLVSGVLALYAPPSDTRAPEIEAALETILAAMPRT
jgi:uncharacterized protein (TIGR02444 family)